METEVLDYLRHIRIRAATTTYHRKQWQIQSFLKYLAAKGKSISGVTRSDVETYLSGLVCSQQYKQAMCCVIREFYDVLKLRHPDICPPENPASSIPFKPDKRNRVFKVPSQSTVDAVFDRLSNADTELTLRNRLMAELAYGSGLRREELHRLNIEDFDLENSTAQVLGKGNKPRVVPLTSKAATTYRRYIIKRHASRGPLLLSFFGRRLSAQQVYYTMRDRVGIRPHLLRHACATHMLQNGAGVRVVQELLGHQRLDCTQRYTAVLKEDLQKVVKNAHPRAHFHV